MLPPLTLNVKLWFERAAPFVIGDGGVPETALGVLLTGRRAAKEGCGLDLTDGSIQGDGTSTLSETAISDYGS